ncbi:MAG: efflux RND transporter periplasmic adaptor subunit [Gammaproteobacteria bacterium]|nr:efflux RND transporter periplasmic adaptor subunit [Gammaproteobacteria bacterium]
MKIVPLLLAVFVCACEQAPELVVKDQSIRPARIFQVVQRGATIKHEFVARIEAAQTVDVSFEVSGPLARLPVLEGQSVPAGALIAELEPTDFLLAVREAEVQLKLARQDLTRKRKLLTERGISRSDVDNAQASFDLSGVRLAQTREALADTKIFAPFDAYVSQRFIDNHANVRAGDRIVRLSDLRELFVVANMPENLLATATLDRVLGLHARFLFLPDRRFELEYRENRGEADAVAQTYEMTFAMPRPESVNILPGMTATLEVELTAEAGSGQRIDIPTSALVAGADKGFIVWIYDPQSHLVEMRSVKVGPAAGRGISVVAGLRGGELVVATGASQLQQGMKIQVLGEPVTEL